MGEGGSWGRGIIGNRKGLLQLICKRQGGEGRGLTTDGDYIKSQSTCGMK